MKNSLLKTDNKAKYSGLYFSVLIVAMLAISTLLGLIFPNAIQNKPDDNLLFTFLSFALSGLTILGVTVYYAFANEENILQTFQWKKTSSKYYLIAVFAFVAVFFGLGNLNEIFIDFLSEKFGYEASTVTLPSLNPFNYIMVVLTVCILPAVAEEIAMRGIILKGIQTGKTVVNALIGGFIFAIYHMNPAQTPYQFAIGFIFSLIAIKSRSTLPTTITHFLNNFVIINIEYFFPTFSFFGGAGIWAVAIPGIICFVALVVLLIMDDGDVDEKAEVKATGAQNYKEQSGSVKDFVLTALVGFVVCVLVWVLGLFS